jgi:outer membrane protein assembly factor BamB
VFAVGSTLRFYALDANTGELLWQRPLGPRHEEMEKAKIAGVKEGRFLGGNYGNRSWGFVPIAAAGLIICNDKSGGLVGFDPASGARRWHATHCAADNSTPAVWKDGEKEWLLVANLSRLSCLDAKSGEEVWGLDKVVGRAMTAHDGLLAFREQLGKPASAHTDVADPVVLCVVFRLQAEGPELLWSTPWDTRDEQGRWMNNQYSSYMRPMIHDGKLYLSGGAWTDCFDAISGKHLARVKGEGGVANAGHLMLAHGRLFINRDGKHGTTQLAMYAADPDDFRVLGEPEIWSPPHPNTTS